LLTELTDHNDDHNAEVASRQWRLGTVTRIDDEFVSVALLPEVGCAGCKKAQKMGIGPGHCGIDLLGLARTSQPIVVRVPITDTQLSGATFKSSHQPFMNDSLTVGDAVDVQINGPSDAWLTLVLRVYGVPTAGLLAGAGLGGVVNEIGSLLLGLLGLCTGLWFSRRSVHIPTSLVALVGPHQPPLRIVSRVNRFRS
jgi:hypothetical protein